MDQVDVHSCPYSESEEKLSMRRVSDLLNLGALYRWRTYLVKLP